MRNRLTRHGTVATAVIVLFVAGCVYLTTLGHPTVGDEEFYAAQIRQFKQGTFVLDSWITTVPGYHLVMAALARLFGAESLEALRLITLGFGLTLVLVFHRCAVRANPSVALLRTLSLFFLPILFPYVFLIFTDTFSLLFVFLALLAYLTDRPRIAGVIATVSLMARQTNIVWLAMLFTMLYVKEHGLSLASIRQHVVRHWPFAVGLSGFAVFVAINGGVAVGDAARHPLSLHLDNVFVALFVFAILFAPSNIANSSRIFDLLHRRPAVLAALAGCFLLYLFAVRFAHPYFEPLDDWYLRNRLQAFATRSLALKALTFIPMGWALLSLAVTRFTQREFYLLYPFSMLALMPHWLVEPRYYIPPFAVFLLAKRPERAWIEWTTLAWFALLALWLFFGMRDIRFIP